MSTLSINIKALFPGFILAGLVAMSAGFVASQTGSPVMLMALLFGMVINFVTQESPERVMPGLDFSAKVILKIGIVLLGARISLSILLSLGWMAIIKVSAALTATVIFGLLLGKILGKSREFSLLTAGAVSICGASAALAIASVLPNHKDKDCDLFFTVVGVTIFSTIAMVLYPPLLSVMGYSDDMAGMIFGATIHDVAQVVGAGFSVSNEAGETATIVKLIRVSLLAPFVLILALFYRRQPSSESGAGKKPPLIPLFVLGFIALVLLNSFGYIPEALKEPINLTSRAMLVLAIAAVGIKTSLKEFVSVGKSAIGMLAAQTVFIFIFVLGLIQFLPV